MGFMKTLERILDAFAVKLAALICEAFAKSQNEDPLMSMEESAAFCRYEDMRSFMGWVKEHKVVYERRGKRKYFFKSNLRRALNKAQKPFGE